MPGRKWHKPTEEMRKQIMLLSAVGVRQEDIAAKFDVSVDTLARHYRKELSTGRIDANARVAQTLFQQATAGNTTAMIFWLKTQAGWRETATHEIVGANGGPVQVSTINVMPVAVERTDG